MDDTQTELDELLAANPPGTPGYLAPDVQKRVSELHGQIAGSTGATPPPAPPMPKAAPQPQRAAPPVNPVRSFLDQAYSGFTRSGFPGPHVEAGSPFMGDDSAATSEIDGDLLDDAPGDDRVDGALKARLESYERAQDLNWLLEGARKGARRQNGTQPGQQPATEEQPPQGSEPFMTSLARTSELPRQIVGGARDAAQSMLDLGAWIDDQIELGGLAWDDDGNLQILGSEDFAKWKSARGGKGVQLPDVGAPQTIAGEIARPIAQFMSPFWRR